MSYEGLWKTEIGNCLVILKNVYIVYLYNRSIRMQCEVIFGKYCMGNLISVLPKRKITLVAIGASNDMCIIHVRRKGAQIDDVYGKDGHVIL